MKPKRMFTLAVAILAIAVIYIFFKAPPTGVGTITLSMSNGVCVKTLVGNNGGASMKAHQNGKALWNVTNNCTTDVTIKVGDFTPESGPGDSPILKGNDTCTASAGGGTCAATPIELKIKGDAKIGKYLYSVFINGAKVDPDLMIET